MKITYSFIKRVLISFVLCLSLFLSAKLIHTIINERANSDQEVSSERCNESYIIFYSLCKCSLAFLFGGIVSDLKFIKFGF